MSEQFSTEQLKLKSNLTCMMSMILFASGFVAVESLLNAGWHPVYLNFLRHIMVVSLLIPIWIYFDGLKTLLGANWIWGIFVGGIGFGFGSLLLLYGQVFSDPITVTIVSGLFPAVSVFLEVLLDKRKLNKEFVIGVSIAFIGGTVVILESENMVNVSWGALCTLLAVIFFSWASRANVIDFPDLSTLGQTSICMTGSCCFMFPAFVVMSYTDQLQPGSIFDMSEIELGQLMIYAILGMAVSQFFLDFRNKTNRVRTRVITFKCYTFLCYVDCGYFRRGMEQFSVLRCRHYRNRGCCFPKFEKEFYELDRNFCLKMWNVVTFLHGRSLVNLLIPTINFRVII